MEPMEVEIDDSLYSRQRYVLGDSAMHKMGSSSVFISGIGGLGVEIAKNVILAGVKSVTIHDDKTCSISDLSSQFFLREEDVKACKNRAMACSERLKELNPYVDINHVTFTIDSSTDLSFLTNYQCVIFTDTPFDVMEIIDSFCRSQKPPIKFIAGSVRGVACYGFCDFGDSFTVLDKNGEDPIEFFISSITQEDPAVVTCLPNERHGLEDGDMIELNEVTGMESVNGKNYRVKVISPTKFSINLNASLLNEYKNGGRAKQIKTPSNINFRSLSQEIKSPTYQMVDFAKMDSPPCILLFFLALDKYLRTYHKFPRPHNAEDSQIVFTMAQEIGKTFESQIDNVDEKLIRELAGASEGLLPPLATTLGGILAQECLIGLTGKFSPLNQWVSYIYTTSQLHYNLTETLDTSCQCVCVGNILILSMLLNVNAQTIANV
jgi:ubiquitin-activating enzyme E1-like protein 2